MANPHFGNIGDVWKHLALAAILALERPGRYWESHSGAAKYALSSSLSRDYGIFYFLKNVSRSQMLRGSAYNRTLEEIEEMNGSIPSYPGSPLLALLLLRGYTETFIFCDTDPECTESINDCAAWLGINGRRLQCICKDGATALRGELERARDEDALDTLIFIDPFDPFDGLDLGDSAFDLFCHATLAGAKTVHWYGFSSGPERTACWDNILETLKAYEIDSSGSVLWCGEICLRLMDDPAFTLNPGVRGCGILTANLSDRSTRDCTDLGNELSRVYERAKFPTGQSGAFDFNTVSIW